MIYTNPIEVVLVEGPWWENIAVWISLFAACVSLVTVAFSVWQNVKKDRSIQTEYFFRIVEDILVTEFPVTRRSLLFDEKKGSLFDSYMKLTDVITELRKKMQFFYFQDRAFYNKLDGMLIDLDEMIVEEANKRNVSEKEQKIFFSEIDNRISKIYKELLKKHVGKK